MQRIIRVSEVRSRLGGISRSTFYNWINPGSKYFKEGFPKKVRVGNVVGFLECEVEAFIQRLAENR
jgi:prophage regulatory protein